MSSAWISKLRKKAAVCAPVKVAQLTEKDQEIKSCCEKSFYHFVREAWPHVEGGEYTDGWHIRAICEHLELLEMGLQTRLIINQPPRTGKSLLCSVFFPAWLFLKNPSEKIISVSYSKQLTVRDSTKCRRLMTSPWYKNLWGDKVKLTEDVNQKTFYETTANGHRIATSTNASTTGFGGNYIICDDLESVGEIGSKNYRDSNHVYFDEVLSTRHAGDPSKLRIAVIQQRCHEADTSGWVLAKDDSRWVHLRLPMEYEVDSRCITVWTPSCKSPKHSWADPRTKEGQLLWPEMITKESVRLMKEKDFNNNEYIISGQLQQRPSPRGGAIFRNDWFKIWPHTWLPPFRVGIPL